MRARFTQSFKIQAVEKALSRSEHTSLLEVAKMLGVGHSTLSKWIVKSRNNEFDDVTNQRMRTDMAKDKRPHDWSLEDRFTMVLECHGLDEEAVSSLCRERGCAVSIIGVEQDGEN